MYSTCCTYCTLCIVLCQHNLTLVFFLSISCWLPHIIFIFVVLCNFPYLKMTALWENNSRLWKIIFIPWVFRCKIGCGLWVLMQFIVKNQIFIFRVAIYVRIWVILTQIGTLIKKNNSRFRIFMLKNLEIWILIFRVPKKSMSGLPYLLKPWLTFFNFFGKSISNL